MTKPDLSRIAHDVFTIEAEAVAELANRIDQDNGSDFTTACEILLACKGRVVITGMGKSGHIGGKIAATLASTGTPAFFVHPGEASHGDLGMITSEDVVVALSNSGETSELLTLLPLLKRIGVPLISLTGKPQSTLANAANVNLDVGVAKEACPHDLAPTASTTASLAMGDALAVALLEARGFTADDFARSHPGGRLGRRLLLNVEDLMHAEDDLPSISIDSNLSAALMEMTSKGLGMTAVIDGQGKLLGIFTDGDLRRALDQNIDVHNAAIKDIMTTGCKTVKPGMLAEEALNLMQTHAINGLIVVDDNRIAQGALNMHDMLKAGIV